MPGYQDDPYRMRGAMTLEHRREDDLADDVAAAHEGFRRTDVPFGRPGRKRTVGDHAARWVHVYGWRAYALPVLVVVTIAALLTMRSPSSKGNDAGARGPAAPVVTDGGKGNASPKVAPPNITLKSDVPNGNYEDLPLASDSLPAGASFTRNGQGTFRILKGTSPKVGTGHLWRYSIDVENGISDFNAKQFATEVVTVLSDQRSWAGHGIALERVDSGQIDFHVTMTSTMTVRRFCGYSIQIETSCYAQAYSVDGLDVNRVLLNEARWVRGSAAYVGDLASYRIYMINHEDGHALGHSHAHECLPDGLAPVMMQQTITLKAKDGRTCGANPWPYPPGVKGTPGIEIPGT